MPKCGADWMRDRSPWRYRSLVRPMLLLARWVHAINPVVQDVVLALVLLAITIGYAYNSHNPGFVGFDPLAIVLTSLTILPVAVRRLAPVSSMAVVGLAMLACSFSGYIDALVDVGLLLTMYTVAAQCAPRRAKICAASSFLVLILVASQVTSFHVLADVLIAAVLTTAAYAFGWGRRKLTERNEQLALLTEQLRHEHEDRAARAVTEERVRIARELHDVVAHHMSVVSVQAGLARYVFESDPVTARAALGTIADTSSEALTEMRRLLNVLRVGADEGGDYAPAPGLGRLTELAERVRAAGVPVEVRTFGAARPLPPGLDQCAYRVVQESLTNVLKHARPARASVDLDYGRTEFTLRVRDDGAVRAPDAAGEQRGQGIAGMLERAKLYGGKLSAGAAPGGGFVVTLTLPLAMTCEGEAG
ncbi:two-component system sensor kinase [Kutzneria albida DSM 43870]|uniref:histidine kinase n=2 Tax=Pseudonocardiaceae TaxID=2070 RepID=W5W2I0_9PSEU|nr:two-component system sensor kinase [Kutzneria albida DSM 43870]